MLARLLSNLLERPPAERCLDCGIKRKRAGQHYCTNPHDALGLDHYRNADGRRRARGEHRWS